MKSKIHDLRKQRKLTLKQLSKMSGVPFNTVWRMEHGYGTALKHAYQLATAFHTTIYELWDIPKSTAFAEAVGDNASVSQLRSRRGWTLDELARRALVSKTTLSQVENGHTPTVGNAIKIATALGVSVYQVWQPQTPD